MKESTKIVERKYENNNVRKSLMRKNGQNRDLVLGNERFFYTLKIVMIESQCQLSPFKQLDR